MEFIEAFAIVLDSAVRLSVPLIFCCLAGLYSERSGVVDIGLEGKMLIAAFAAAAVATSFPGIALFGGTWRVPASSAVWFGLLAAVIASILFSLIHGVSSITYRGNQIISGVAINMLALGLTALLGNVWYGEGGRTPQLDPIARFQPIDLPFALALQNVPIVGPFYSGVISGHDILTYIAFLCVPLTGWIVYKTRFGLRLRAVGENPAAVDTAGISVARLRYGAIIIGGVLTGFAGAYLSIAQSAQFVPNMTAGKGFMALAALIFGKWRPWPSLAACMLFGFLDALSIRMQGVVIPVIGQVPVQMIQALPYILTVVLLAGFIGTATPPRASGIPYVKER